MKCFLSVALVAATAAMAADVSVVDLIVAKVNGDIITKSEIERSKRQLEADLKQRSASVNSAQAAQLRQQFEERSKDMLREKIDTLLLVQKGKEMSVNVDQQFSKYQAEMMKSLKIADQEQFANMVREQTGQTYEDWRNETKNAMLTQRVVGQEVQSKINVSAADVAKYFEEHKTEFVREERVFLQEIFLRTDGKNDAAVEKKAKDLVARAKKNERFAELARDNSESDSAAQGGDIGGLKKGELDPVIEKLVFEGGKGFVTDPPLRRPNGFLILKVAEVHKAGQATLEEVEQEIRERLYVPKMQPAVREYLTRLRTEAFLEIRDGWTDSGAAPGKDTSWTDPAELKPETVSKEELSNQKRKKRFLGIPVPGTSTSVAEKEAEKEEKGVSASKALKAK
jgi:peptidyl-prolyl cis-trans isomerase SurA